MLSKMGDSKGGWASVLWRRATALFGVKRPRVQVTIPTNQGRGKAAFQRAIIVKTCQACGLALRSYPKLACTNVPPHFTHERCAEMVQGKCPICGFALEGFQKKDK